MLGLIGGEKFLEEKTEEEWDNIERLVKLRKLEQKLRLGLIKRYDYQMRRNKICTEIVRNN